MNILITGLMGSGKSTQAKLLADYLNLCFLTTGDVLRQISKEDSDLGRYLKDTLSKGEMVDDRIVADLIKKRLEEPDAKNGFVSDSYPRRISQVGYFDPKLDLIFFLNVDPNEAKKRLLARGRPDDTQRLIDLRHKTQGKGIEELVFSYRGKIKIIDIDASGSVNDTFNRIKEYIDAHRS